jgi:hypothetical protein
MIKSKLMSLKEREHKLRILHLCTVGFMFISSIGINKNICRNYKAWEVCHVIFSVAVLVRSIFFFFFCTFTKSDKCDDVLLIEMHYKSVFVLL